VQSRPAGRAGAHALEDAILADSGTAADGELTGGGALA
jgi:hypothetical protein